jgi:hypothetical protein
MHTIMEVILIASSLLATVVALLDLAGWAAIAVSCGANVSAWLQFQGTNAKMERYSVAADQLQSVVLWWESLTELERAAPETVNTLVEACEEAVKNELKGWKSTSRSLKLLEEKANMVKKSGVEKRQQTEQPDEPSSLSYKETNTQFVV